MIHHLKSDLRSELIAKETTLKKMTTIHIEEPSLGSHNTEVKINYKPESCRVVCIQLNRLKVKRDCKATNLFKDSVEMINKLGDAILLVEKKDNLYILAIEMKSSTTEKTIKNQLHNAEALGKYIVDLYSLNYGLSYGCVKCLRIVVKTSKAKNRKYIDYNHGIEEHWNPSKEAYSLICDSDLTLNILLNAKKMLKV